MRLLSTSVSSDTATVVLFVPMVPPMVVHVQLHVLIISSSFNPRDLSYAVSVWAYLWCQLLILCTCTCIGDHYAKHYLRHHLSSTWCQWYVPRGSVFFHWLTEQYSVQSCPDCVHRTMSSCWWVLPIFVSLSCAGDLLSWHLHLSHNGITSSSAVAQRPHDASYLSVVSFSSTIPGVQFLKNYLLLVSYLPVHTIRFCSVLFGVTLSLADIYTIHGRPWLCIAQDRAWSVSHCTVMDNHDCL